MKNAIAKSKQFIADNETTIILVSAAIVGAFIGGMAVAVDTKNQLEKQYDFVPKTTEN